MLEGKREPLLTDYRFENYLVTLESKVENFQSLKINLPYDQAVIIRSIFSMNSAFHFPETYLWSLLQFIITIKWKQHKFPSNNFWIMKMWYIYTIESCKEIWNCVRIKKGKIILSKIAQTHKNKYHIFSLIWCSLLKSSDANI